MFVYIAGNAGRNKSDFDSDDDKDLEIQQTSQETKLKQNRSFVDPPSMPAIRAKDATPPPTPTYGKNWQWVSSGHWMPPPTMTALQWGMPPPPPSAPYADRGMVLQPRSGPYPDSWVVPQTTTNFPSTEDLSADVAGRVSRRLKRSMHGEGKTDGIVPSKKPNKITVTELGEIDPRCIGKNAWDASVREYVPRILDMSIIDFEKQKA